MEEQQICCGRTSAAISDFPQLPSSSSSSGLQYPWLVSYDSECQEDTDQIFSTMQPNFHQNQHYHCRIPELQGRKIQGCFHGWVVLSKLTPSDFLEFSLWNPVTREFIDLPGLKLEREGIVDDSDYNGDDIFLCCLSSTPSNPDSVLLLTRFSKPNIVFYRLSSKRKPWTELSYANQIRNVSNCDNDEIGSLFCCNGNVYASTVKHRFIQVDTDILVDQDVINLLPIGMLPVCQLHVSTPHLTGNCKELFTIVVCYDDIRFITMQSVKLFKLDFSTKTWEELKNVEDRVFFLLEGSCSQISCLATESESGPYIHIIRNSCELVYSYNMEDKTISLSLPCPDLPAEMWPDYSSTWVMPENRYCHCSFDHGETNGRSDTDEEQGKEEEEIGVRSVISGEVDRMTDEQLGGMTTTTGQGPLLHIPFHILELILEHCGPIDYLNFRATCKQFRLAAPWSTATALGRLQKHSLISPWLMVLDEYQGITIFTDPMFGDKYFTTTFPDLIGHVVICASNYGWLLAFGGDFICPIFFNPFTKVIIRLPQLELPFTRFSSFHFSKPPTSPLCTVVAFVINVNETVYITSPGESDWRAINIQHDIPYNRSSHNSRIFYGDNLYILCRDGQLGILRFDRDFSWEILVVEPPRTCTSCTILAECNNDLLLIIVDEFGQWVEVFKLNHSSPQWEKVYDIGKHMIYVCHKACFSVAAKIPGMENKIYFSRFRGGNILFYCLDTRKLHSFGAKGKEEEEAFKDFFQTKEQLMGVWIEPSWSS